MDVATRLPKLARSPTPSQSCVGSSGTCRRENSSELYRMTDDPDQENNLSAETGLASELRELVESRRFVSQGREHTIDSEIEQRLRSLGYVR